MSPGVAVTLFAWQVDEHRESSRALDDRADSGALEADQQVTLPVARHRTILDFGQAFADQRLAVDVEPTSCAGAFARRT